MWPVRQTSPLIPVLTTGLWCVAHESLCLLRTRRLGPEARRAGDQRTLMPSVLSAKRWVVFLRIPPRIRFGKPLWMLLFEFPSPLRPSDSDPKTLLSPLMFWKPELLWPPAPLSMIAFSGASNFIVGGGNGCLQRAARQRYAANAVCLDRTDRSASSKVSWLADSSGGKSYDVPS